MRKILISLAVTAATLTAVPAAAQYRDNDRRWDQREDRWDQREDRWDQREDRWDQRDDHRDRRAVQHLLRELDRVQQRVERSSNRGIISPREAFALRRELSRVRDRLHRSARNGLSHREVRELSFQIDRVEQRLRFERRDRDGRRG